MNHDDLKKTPRDLLLKFCEALEREFDLTEVGAMVKKMFPRLQGLSEDGRCWSCGDRVEGHFFQECVARQWGRIDHLYRPKGCGD